MISKSFSIINSTILRHKSKIDTYAAQLKNNLAALLAGTTLSSAEREYIRLTHSLADYLTTLFPYEIAFHSRRFERIIPSAQLVKKPYKNFRKKILNALGYASRRNDFYPIYFSEIGINACVYCNSQLTVAIDKKTLTGQKKIAKFQVDHVLPKSGYPAFSVSLFNLVPVCASCNNCKGVKEVAFSLYEEKAMSKSQFKFGIDLASRVKFLTTRKITDIELTFHEPSVTGRYKSFEEVFGVSAIYNTQKDIAAELVLKAEAYSSTYKAELMKAFPQIFTDLNISNRLIIGNYVEEWEIHNRPLAKFTQDIARDIGLI